MPCSTLSVPEQLDRDRPGSRPCRGDRRGARIGLAFGEAAIRGVKLADQAMISGTSMASPHVAGVAALYLLLNAEHMVTRETLLAVVWGPDSDLQSNALDVHIRHLRKKLECAGLDGVIETVRGRSFMLRVSDAEETEVA